MLARLRSRAVKFYSEIYEVAIDGVVGSAHSDVSLRAKRFQ